MNKKSDDPIRKKTNSYLKYSGLAFQMAAIILLSIWGGKKIDAYMGWEKPFATLLLTLILFSGFMYKLYLDLTKDQ